MKTLSIVLDWFFGFLSMIVVPVGIIMQALLQTATPVAQKWELMLSLLIGASVGTYIQYKADHLSNKEIYLRMVLAFGSGYPAAIQVSIWFPGLYPGFNFMASGFSMLFVFSILFKFLKDFETKRYASRFFENKFDLDDKPEKTTENVGNTN